MKPDPQTQIPLYIKLEDYYVFKMEKHDIRQGKVASNPKTANSDMRILRSLQLRLLEEGTLQTFVNWRYVARLLDEHPTYIKMVMYRLARGGFVERHRKPYNYTKGLWNVYYWCAKVVYV